MKIESWYCFNFYILKESLKYQPDHNAVIFILIGGTFARVETLSTVQPGARLVLI